MKSHASLLVPLLLLLTSAARASELGLLLDKLAEKGVLTAEEAAALAPPARPRLALDLVPEFRLRYQYDDNSANAASRSRGRYSMRLGGEAGNGGRLRLLFGLAGGSDPGGRSTNQSFGRNMEKKNIYINYAYAEYAPAGWLTLRGGRMNGVLWDPTDMVWDSDLKPEGAAASVSLRRGAAEFFSAAGFAALGESLAGPRDPYLVFAQQGVSGHALGKKMSLKAAVAYYAFGGVKGAAELPGRPSVADGYLRSNSSPGGRYAGGYDACHASFEAGYAPASALPAGIKSLSVFGEYIRNTTLSRASEGWIAGLRAGHRKPEAAGQWQLIWSLRRLEAEAWLDVYPDADFYGGSTGIKGGEVSLNVSLGSGVLLGADYYLARRISGGGEEALLQTDLSFRL